MWFYDEIGSEYYVDYETGRYIGFDNNDYGRPLKPKSCNPYDDDYSEEEITEMMYKKYLADKEMEEMILVEAMYQDYLKELEMEAYAS